LIGIDFFSFSRKPSIMTTEIETIKPDTMPRTALLVGLGGLIPFIGLATVIALAPEIGGLGQRALHMALVTYAALIASFIGGVRWGNALSGHSRQTHEFIISVIPSLLAWLALATPRPFDLMLLIGVFLALGVSDVGLAISGGAPRWYGKLRVFLTAIATLSLLSALFAQS
jgi:flagellar motor component MotA